MLKNNFIRLLAIIGSILLVSILIGDTIMTPIIFYHKLLVRFFGWLFLLLIISLIVLKFKANYQFIFSGFHEIRSKTQIIKMTILDTIYQISHKSLRFLTMTFFLMFILAITGLIIWINNKLVSFPGN